MSTVLGEFSLACLQALLLQFDCACHRACDVILSLSFLQNNVISYEMIIISECVQFNL